VQALQRSTVPFKALLHHVIATLLASTMPSEQFQANDKKARSTAGSIFHVPTICPSEATRIPTMALMQASIKRIEAMVSHGVWRHPGCQPEVLDRLSSLAKVLVFSVLMSVILDVCSGIK